MAEPSSIPPASTFVIRFWRDWSSAGSRWRARIEHLQSGESAICLDLKGISEFMQRLVVGMESAGGHGDEER